MTTAEPSWEDLQPADPAWWHGASGREVCEFEIFPAVPGFSSGDGGGLELRSTDDLKDDAAIARVLLGDPRTKTSWVTSYARLLAHELRRRAKASAA